MGSPRRVSRYWVGLMETSPIDQTHSVLDRAGSNRVFDQPRFDSTVDPDERRRACRRKLRHMSRFRTDHCSTERVGVGLAQVPARRGNLLAQSRGYTLCLLRQNCLPLHDRRHHRSRPTPARRGLHRADVDRRSPSAFVLRKNSPQRPGSE